MLNILTQQHQECFGVIMEPVFFRLTFIRLDHFNRWHRLTDKYLRKENDLVSTEIL